MENRCCFCNDIIPEGRIICPRCEQVGLYKLKKADEDFQQMPSPSHPCTGCRHRNKLAVSCSYCKRNSIYMDNYSPEDK